MSSSMKNKPKQASGAGARRGGKGKIPVKRSPISKAYNRAPRVRTTTAGDRNNACRVITHREMCGTYTSGTSGFQVLTLSKPHGLNPRNAGLFPWLSYQAAGWEHFRILKLKFTMVSGNPTTASGRVYAFIDYDYDDNAATSIDQFSTAEGAVSTNVWDTLSLTAHPQMLHADHKWKFILGSNSVELRTVYCGFLNLAVNTSSALTWDLWVDYTIEFKTPQILAPSISQAVTAPFPLSSIGGIPITPNTTLPHLVAGISTPPLAVQAGVDMDGQIVIDLSPVRRGSIITSCIIDECVEAPISNVIGLAKYVFLWDKYGNTVPNNQASYTFTTESSSGTWTTAGTPIFSQTYELVQDLLALGVKYLAVALVNSVSKAEANTVATVSLAWRP